MFHRSKIYNRNIVSLAATTLLLIITFTLIGFVALSALIGNNPGQEIKAVPEYPTSNPVAAVPSAGTPDPSEVITFKSPVLGFRVEYPRAWRKDEKGLQVIFSPSTAGLDPNDLQDAAIWLGIPMDNTVDPVELLTQIQASLIPDNQPAPLTGAVKDTTIIGAQSWSSTEFSFEDEQLGGPAIAKIATTSHNRVGYFVVAVAPAEQWNSIEPTFQNILNSFRFTSEAVLRPTDATPPPTPTATPTPVIYIVQSGDTLLQIALQYGVDVEALAARNGIDDPRSLRTGARLVIPLRHR